MANRVLAFVEVAELCVRLRHYGATDAEIAEALFAGLRTIRPELHELATKVRPCASYQEDCRMPECQLAMAVLSLAPPRDN